MQFVKEASWWNFKTKPVHHTRLVSCLTRKLVFLATEQVAAVVN